MQENEAAKISPADKQRYFKICKRVSPKNREEVLSRMATNTEAPCGTV